MNNMVTLLESPAFFGKGFLTLYFFPQYIPILLFSKIQISILKQQSFHLWNTIWYSWGLEQV